MRRLVHPLDRPLVRPQVGNAHHQFIPYKVAVNDDDEGYLTVLGGKMMWWWIITGGGGGSGIEEGCLTGLGRIMINHVQTSSAKNGINRLKIVSGGQKNR